MSLKLKINFGYLIHISKTLIYLALIKHLKTFSQTTEIDKKYWVQFKQNK